MQLRHIKGLDIVQNEVNRIMPNDLSKFVDGHNPAEDEETEQQTELQIKRDLEDVEDIFAANVFSAKMGGGVDQGASNQSKKKDKDQNNQEVNNDLEDENPPPEEEWLSTSNSEKEK